MKISLYVVMDQSWINKSRISDVLKSFYNLLNEMEHE